MPSLGAGRPSPVGVPRVDERAISRLPPGFFAGGIRTPARGRAEPCEAAAAAGRCSPHGDGADEARRAGGAKPPLGIMIVNVQSSGLTYGS